MSKYKASIPSPELANAFTGQVQPLVNKLVSAVHESHALAAQQDVLLPKLVSHFYNAEMHFFVQEQ